MNKFFRNIILITLPIFITACDFGQRQAAAIFTLSAKQVTEDVKKAQEGSSNDKDTEPVNILDLERNEAVAFILSRNSIVYSDIIEAVDYHQDPTFTAEVISGLLLKSDRVCKDYLYKIIDVRNGYKITNKALGTLPTILTVFGLPGTDIITVGRITSIQDGVANSLTDIGIDEVSLLNNLKDIQNVRKKMRNAIHNAFSQNIEMEYIGTGPSKNSKKAYSVFSALLDLETYHETCSFYEKIYFNFDVPEKLGQLNAFRLLETEKQNAVTKS